MLFCFFIFSESSVSCLSCLCACVAPELCLTQLHSLCCCVRAGGCVKPCGLICQWGRNPGIRTELSVLHTENSLQREQQNSRQMIYSSTSSKVHSCRPRSKFRVMAKGVNCVYTLSVLPRVQHLTSEAADPCFGKQFGKSSGMLHLGVSVAGKDYGGVRV